MRSWTSVVFFVWATSSVLAAVDPQQLQQHLSRGVGIMGNYSTSGRLTDWMAVLDSATPLQSLNLPGTHDSAAWNPPLLTRTILQTQQFPIFDQLNAGIRFFDLRFGVNDDGTLGLYHADQLLDPNAKLEDVFWGFYHFLDNHPTETLFLSVKVDHGATSPAVQQTVHDLITGAPGSEYWIVDPNFSNLGAVRGKIILFRRFDWAGEGLFGMDMTKWQDNNPSFSITYNGNGGTAWIEDLYQMDLGNVTADTVVSTKLAAVVGQLRIAGGSDSSKTTFYVTFASGGGQIASQYVTPRTLALGSTSSDPNSATKGVNAGLLEYLQEQPAGARLGVILLDFYDSPTDVVLASIANSNVKPNIISTPSSTTAYNSPTDGPSPGGGGGASSLSASISPLLVLFCAGVASAAL